MTRVIRNDVLCDIVATTTVSPVRGKVFHIVINFETVVP